MKKYKKVSSLIISLLLVVTPVLAIITPVASAQSRNSWSYSSSSSHNVSHNVWTYSSRSSQTTVTPTPVPVTTTTPTPAVITTPTPAPIPVVTPIPVPAPVAITTPTPAVVPIPTPTPVSTTPSTMQWGAYVTSSLTSFESEVGAQANIQADFEGWMQVSLHSLVAQLVHKEKH